MKFCQWIQIYAFYRYFVRITSWKIIEIRFIFFSFSYKENKENWNWHIKVVLVEIPIIIMIIVCFILYKLETMRFLGWHPPHLMDNTDTLYLEDQYWQQPVLLLRFLLFCVHQFAYMSVSLGALWSVCNITQVFKRSL